MASMYRITTDIKNRARYFNDNTISLNYFLGSISSVLLQCPITRSFSRTLASNH